MSFHELPLEIQQRIISYLPSDKDVAALSVQCRALHFMSDMATRQKFHRISVFPDEYGIDVRHIECCTTTSLYADYEVTRSQRGLNDEDMNLVHKAVREAEFTGPDEQQVEEEEEENQKPQITFFTQALTAILTAVSPSLVLMAITKPVCGRFGHPTKEFPLAEFLRWANSEPESKPYLQNLRDVYLININNSNGWDETCYQEMDFYGCCGLLDSLSSIESVSADLV
ncbi:uncharacterized protein N7477_005399 [Penicillium maclennaniae]|uniref:uncharacterized protein n=1 Tax=Penicillium maclennaniae TaxID=1343394 RepID=UPI0025401E2D|nr:uncharacterized protein N7477_005399 [Penicillium maclennaniae]KAJ5670036.1 hypothetical protein N7477_005399 [Penicillium maclennaniae]